MKKLIKYIVCKIKQYIKELLNEFGEVMNGHGYE